MDHTTVVRDKTTERYLLNELDSKLRDEFEEHYFGCPECALDVSAGTQFVEQSKVVLAEKSALVSVRETPGRNSAQRGWFGWLRPAFAAPALAILLAVMGYQNLVTYPKLNSELGQPQVLPSVSVNVGTWGAGSTPTSIPEGKGLLLFVRIPPDPAYVRYTAELFSPSGKAQGSFTITPVPDQDQWSVIVPAVPREAGTYRIAVRGVTNNGVVKDLGGTTFQLQIQR
ncbi:MAG: hypothetical protein DMG79_03675 [Acidobacteria bacterium]|nr:MAG: hypothetical protein DMG79_03675 [Acidobacteriota bacterium]